jgi:tryptophan-rich sensory protein
MTAFFEIIFFIVAAESIGLASSIFTFDSIPNWYTKLRKPFFNPPNWIFAPVWTIIYATLGSSVFLVWQKGWDSNEVKFAIAIFAVQFILNFAWTAIFFGLNKTFFALMEIVILWIFILLTIVLFYPLSQTAALLLIPYLLWVSFAALLNFYIWKLN